MLPKASLQIIFTSHDDLCLDELKVKPFNTKEVSTTFVSFFSNNEVVTRQCYLRSEGKAAVVYLLPVVKS